MPPTIHFFISSPRPRLTGSLAPEKAFFLDLLPDLHRRARNQVLHRLPLRGGQLRQVTDEPHQLPALLLAIRRPGPEAGHPCESYAVFDHIEELAVGEPLCGRITQV